jgi:hypothetical protein
MCSQLQKLLLNTSIHAFCVFLPIFYSAGGFQRRYYFILFSHGYAVDLYLSKLTKSTSCPLFNSILIWLLPLYPNKQKSLKLIIHYTLLQTNICLTVLKHHTICYFCHSFPVPLNFRGHCLRADSRTYSWSKYHNTIVVAHEAQMSPILLFQICKSGTILYFQDYTILPNSSSPTTNEIKTMRLSNS